MINDNELVNEPPSPQENSTIQTTLTELRTLYNDDGTPNSRMNPSGNLCFDFCFEFVFPIELTYNNGTPLTVNSHEELIEVLISTTSELYVVGIEFPFNVKVYNPETNEIEITAINNETEFGALLASCLFSDPCDCIDELAPVCIAIQENNETVVISIQNACFAEYLGFTEDDFISCFENDEVCYIDGLDVVEIGECNTDGTYSITIDFDHDEADNQQIFVVENWNGVLGYYVLADLPVTIANFETGGGGYDSLLVYNIDTGCLNDLVWETPECAEDNECYIENLELVEIGECNADGTYSITINFDYENIGNQEFFDVYLRNDVLLGYYALADLPLTISNFELSGFEYDYIDVCINDTSACCAALEWEAPECSNDNECDNSSSEFQTIFQSMIYNGHSDIVSFDTEIHEYTFTLSADKVVCKIGYQSQPAIPSTPYLIEIIDNSTSNTIYADNHTFSPTATSYAIPSSAINLESGESYTIRRTLLLNDAGNQFGNIIGRIAAITNNSSTSFPYTNGIMTITNANFYQSGGPLPNAGVPYIDLILR